MGSAPARPDYTCAVIPKASPGVLDAASGMAAGCAAAAYEPAKPYISTAAAADSFVFMQVALPEFTSFSMGSGRRRPRDVQYGIFGETRGCTIWYTRFDKVRHTLAR